MQHVLMVGFDSSSNNMHRRLYGGSSRCMLYTATCTHQYACTPHSAGELSTEELERILVIVSNPRGYKIPDWFLNRQKDIKDGRYSQVTASALDTKLREDLERLKKIRCVEMFTTDVY